jgi:hypothetical protein
MFGNSVIARTGQSWKLVLAILLMVIGSFAPLWEGFRINWTLGTILVVVGYALSIWYITCPKCAALDASLYSPLFKASSCPACKQDFPAQQG